VPGSKRKLAVDQFGDDDQLNANIITKQEAKQHSLEPLRLWKAANPDRAAAGTGCRHARWRFPDCISPDFNLEDTIRFYVEARRLTRETGTEYEVDHIQALCLGGQHIASNLQVITREANCEKSVVEQAEARRRSGRWSALAFRAK
jgi:hypothetical protein